MAVEAVVSAVVQKLADLLIEEAIFLRGVRNQVDWIKAELQGMRCFLRDAEEKQGGDARVKNWIAEIRDVAYDAEDIIDSIILRKELKKQRKAIRRYASVFSDLMAHRNVGNEIERIRTKLREISERRITYGIENLGVIGEASSYAMERLSERRRPSLSDESHVVALEDDLMTVKSRLLENDLKRRVVSIVGMGGLGKTTLAKKVYNDRNVIDRFKCRVWINVSKGYSAKGLLEDIWKKVMGASGDNLALEQMEESLSKHLKKKRYLVVMDDVWDVDAWNSVKAALPVSENGSRVLLTTRNREVAVQADNRSPPHVPKLLSYKNSWVLFLKKVGIEGSECPPNLKQLGKQIVKKCGGLPLAIVVLGGLLSSKEASYSAWSRLLERFNWQLKQDQTNCLEILALSYIDLPHYLKPCFIYFGLYPEDYEISIRRLIGLWVAEGLVEHRHNESLEDVAEEYIEELIDRSMIEAASRSSDGKIKTCRMHDLLRDLAVSKGEEANFFQIHDNKESTLADVVKIRRHAAHNIVDKYPSSIYHLRSYLVFASGFEFVDGELVWKFLDNGIQNKGLGLLRVLDLEGVYRPKLPDALGQLIHLRYLGLRRTDSGSLPSSLGNLRNLQTLDIKHSEISVSDCPIWKLQQLRHLYMNGNKDSKIMHPPVSSSSSSFSLMNLQTLWGLYINEETPVKDGLDNSLHLKKMKVHGDLASQGKSLSDWLFELGRLEVLILKSTFGLPIMMQFSISRHLHRLQITGRFAGKLLKVREFPPNLTMLTLKSCELEEDPFPTLEKLPYLRTLKLSQYSYLGREMVCSSGGFQQLQVLKLRELDLETWKVEDGAMTSLKELHLRSCTLLEMLPDELWHITTLQELDIRDMPERFKSRIQHTDGVDWSKSRHITTIFISGLS